MNADITDDDVHGILTYNYLEQMRGITNIELLQLQLDILRDVDTFSRNNGIEYFLVGGTGIGAARHGGYIPWDDDIDIGMTRPNYDKFVNSFNDVYSNLKVYAPELDWDYYAPYANVCDTRTILIEKNISHRKHEIGVKIDVFPYDGVPSDPIEFEKLRKRVRRLLLLRHFKNNGVNKNQSSNFKALFISFFWKTILSPIKHSSIQKAIHKLSRVVPYEEAIFLDKIVFPYDNNKPLKKEVFESYEDKKFEQLTVRDLKEYDLYLRSIFGDYMQLPPEDQRVPNHGFSAYWK